MSVAKKKAGFMDNQPSLLDMLGDSMDIPVTEETQPGLQRVLDELRPLFYKFLLRSADQVSKEAPRYFDFPYARYSDALNIVEGSRDILLAEGSAEETLALKERAGINYEAWKEAVRNIPDDFEQVRSAFLKNDEGQVFSWSPEGKSPNIVDLETQARAARVAWHGHDIGEGLPFDLNRLQVKHEALCALCALGFEKQIRNLIRPEKVLYSQDSKRPTKHYSPNSKVANAITDPDMFVQKTMLLDVAGRSERAKGKEIVTAVSLAYDEGATDGLILSGNITQFDRAIHDAMSTLWVAGNRVVTPSQIWKAMTGSKREPSKKQTEEIMASVDKQRRIMATIDYTQEARGRDLDIEGQPVSSFIIERHLIEGSKVEIQTVNKQVAIGYNMAEMPVLYEHASALGQVISYPQRLLDTGAGSNTERNIAITKYLLRRIGMIKGKRKTSNRIKYESVYKKAAGVEDPSKVERKRIKDYVKGCLDAWVDQSHIASFEEYKEGRKIAGVEIFI